MQHIMQKQMNQSYELQKINKKQQQELIQLQGKLHVLKNTFTQQEMIKKVELAQQVGELTAKKQAQRAQLKKVYDGLFSKVSYLKKFKLQQRQTQYKQTLQKLQQRQQYLFYSHTKDIDKMKSAFQHKRQQLKQSTSKQIEHIQSLQINKLREKLSLQQQMRKQNDIMQQEIRLCQSEKLLVENQCKTLNQEIKKNQQQQAKTILGGQATQTYQRSLRVLKLQGKITKLKQYHTQQMNRLQQELKSIDKSYDEQQKSTNQKIQKLKTAIGLKQRDFKKVKACSQMVLNQRSSLEAYLLQVFYQNTHINNKDAVNVNQILRKLFVKINSKRTPVSYKNYLSIDNLRNKNNNLGKSSQIINKNNNDNLGRSSGLSSSVNRENKEIMNQSSYSLSSATNNMK